MSGAGPEPIVVSDRLRLRPWAPEDAAPMFALVEDNRAFLARWLPWVGAIEAPDDELAFIRVAHAAYLDGVELHLAIELDGAVVGSCGYPIISPANRRAEIGYWLAERHNGNGYVTSACRALLDHGFGALGLHRIEIRAVPENRPSCAVAERLGFRLEGIEREAHFLNGEFRDLACYAMLAGEWPPTAT